MEAERIQFVERNIACRSLDGRFGRKRERVVICLFTLFLRANDATRRERVRYHGNSAGGYRLLTASPRPKARQDKDQAPVTSSRSEFFVSEMRSSAQAMSAWSLPGNGRVVDPAKFRLRPGPHVTTGRFRSAKIAA